MPVAIALFSCIAVAESLAGNTNDKDNSNTTQTGVASAPQAAVDSQTATVAKAEPSEAKPLQKPAPDPKFVAPHPPVMPVALSAEAYQMVLDMRKAYILDSCGVRQPQQTTHGSTEGGPRLAPVAMTGVLRMSLPALPNTHYVNTALPKLLDPATPRKQLDALYEDLLKRPDPIKLRGLFIIASVDSHPFAASAMDNLRSTMKVDYQQDWRRWQQAVEDELNHESRGVRGMSCRVH